jgi:hypothetical protein
MKNSRFVPSLLVFLFASSSQAGVYEFGGSCPSRGEWTRKALEQTSEISQIIRNLKDNPACKGLETALVDLKEAAEELKTPEDAGTESRIESIPAESEALRNAVMAGGTLNANASSMLLNREIEAAALNSNLQQQTSSSSAPVAAAASMGKNISLGAILSRLKGPTKKGLDLVTNVMKVLPQYDECLIGQPAQGLAILSGAIKVAASFSASGEGVGDKLGNAIAGLMKMMQERKFTQVLRKQDETEFWLSISCLIESTSKNYCDTENAEEILKYSQDQYKEAMKRNLVNRKNPSYDNPLEGYYLLVRELPIISSWLQKVQFGVKPRLGTDAKFKNSVWEEVVEQIKNINSLYGYFNEQMIFMKELKSPSAKRNHLVDVVNHIANVMTGGGGSEGFSSSGSKFFTTTVNETLLPFYLIGRESVPKAVQITEENRIAVDWQTWMRTGGNGDFISDFQDPDKVAQIIETRMGSIIDSASEKSSEYFRQRLVVDMPNLVNQTLSSQYLTVKKSLENVLNYLVRFENKLGADKKDPTEFIMRPSVRETKLKIRKFLDSYNKLLELGEQVSIHTDMNKNLSEATHKAAEEVIMTAFTEFNILFQKDSFLTNRLTTFIERDFAKRIRSGLNMSAHQQDILLITQKNMLEKLTEVHGINPATADLDLASAQMVNKRNLESIEQLFTDSIYRMMVEMKAVVMGTGLAGVSKMLNEKLEKDKSNYRSALKYMPQMLTNPGQYASAYLMAGFAVKQAHPDLYSDPAPNRIIGQDTRFGAYQTMLAKICTQSLAFEHRATFIDLCKGSVLKSYYSKAGVKGLDVKYDEHVTSSNAWAVKRNKTLTSKNICAFNQFSINNLVQMLKDQDKELYEDITAENY